MLVCSHHELSAKQKHRRYELNRLSYLHAPLGAIHGESQFIESAVRHFLVGETIGLPPILLIILGNFAKHPSFTLAILLEKLL